MINISVFASGQGSNLKAIIEAERSGLLGAHVALVVSNNSGSRALEFAREARIETLHASEKHFGSYETYVRELVEALLEHDIELIVLAGYMKKLPEEIVQMFRGRILNVHPALLPLFGGEGMYGMRVHEAVISSGEKESGATVHGVDEEYDRGEIVLQERVPVMPGDTPETLAERIRAVEHKILPKAIAQAVVAITAKE